MPHLTNMLDVSLGIEKIGTSSHEEIIFIAKNIQSKIEWVETIKKALMSPVHLRLIVPRAYLVVMIMQS